ncbi:hypothetical protein [Clostridium magnum]|uniref:Lipoprotein n=1 Tax=Clostridium magnum DSM 2767 TaxID=1121326 RepID=A0A162RU33_9CLOT|nr:hypothetical protein [Clostridium magnum]KZL90379.1 hypothetical protein CLMAG_41500 [Clostridium magnum DSM 2767]SHH83665.1 hypothetical protein SAMN02745944_01529 [Clostridium magnum DSM 2767]
MQKRVCNIFIIVALVICSMSLVSCKAIEAQNITNTGSMPRVNGGAGMNGGPGGNGGPRMNVAPGMNGNTRNNGNFNNTTTR